ncbi:MAG: DEAD/DEAH box helicase [Desulfobacterales bacterium]|nr:DEAD/DEAH box helicase [Deltaproteobacteria bacterium]NNL41392.1 DEAD/DEAH box helicase [Desulfobacterales bacterium]
MNRRRRYPAKKPTQRIRQKYSHKRSTIPKIKPGADAGLKKVFASIGVPAKKSFTPDPFQLEALSAIGKTDCLVTAPTGSGKTWIALNAMARITKKGQKAWYASPLKALSNSKYDEFSSFFGAGNVGILTGDRKENPDAPVIVGTTEILRNQLYDAMHHGETLSVDLVILDEAHFLGDEDRGVVWEEIMIYLPPRISLLLLSATIGNAKQIAGWLHKIRAKECIIVEETKRPVPIFPLFLHPCGTLYPFLAHKDSKGKKRIYKKVVQYLNIRRPPLFAPARRLPPFDEFLDILRKFNLLPAIFFLKSRADCDRALDLCINDSLKKIERKNRLAEKIGRLIYQNSHIANHRQRWHLEHLAVAAHHSGQLPAWKLVIETLMTKGLLDAVFATSTVAAGVNFPARTVVFLNSDRFNGVEFLPLSPTEFHQMTGRAGRRGMDNIGFTVAIPGKFMDLRLAARLVTSRPSDVISQIKINFSMVLNLLLSHTPSQIENLLEKSFATYQLSKQRKKRKGEKYNEFNKNFLWQDFLRHLDFLKENKYVSKSDRLTDDGIWASQLRVDQPLLIGEGFRQRIFPESDPTLLAAIIASLVDEHDADDIIDKTSFPKRLLTSFLTVKKRLQPFSEEMASGGFEVRKLFLRPAVALYAWATGQSWEKVVSISHLEEGTLSMLVLRTADNLRHIRILSDVFPEASKTATTALDLILREPVVVK